MRGEEHSSARFCRASGELPPHARRREDFLCFVAACEGITSACAEKRVRGVLIAGGSGNYLRMRGEEHYASP